jgi:hypothetical protein
VNGNQLARITKLGAENTKLG